MVNQRVDDLAKTQTQSRSRTPSPKHKKLERLSQRSREENRSPSPVHWVDRTDTVADLPQITHISESDNEDRAEFDCMEGTEMPLSEKTFKAATEALSTTLENWKRRDIRGQYPVSDTPVMRTLKVDDVFSSLESRNAEACQLDKDLLQLQSYMLDATKDH